MHVHIWPCLQCLILKCLLGDFGHLGICAGIVNINRYDSKTLGGAKGSKEPHLDCPSDGL